ncbi:MAG: AraC family transcriptional regulator, partial [Clostridia bacterium]|nr:AraC family transcriptional regulator [Clostridia bacterium]
AKSVFAFTETEIPVNELCSCAFPPTIYLSHTECKKVENLFQTINYIPGDKHIEKRLQCKFILINLFSKYFIRFNSSPSDSDIPSWLSGAYEQMKSVKNFREGTPAMIKLCGKSYEHVSRSIKKYYGTTLTEYINTLRLNYAANLLTNTNYTLTDIYLECGFNSPSYFSSSFKNHYGLSPYEYRKKL